MTEDARSRSPNGVCWICGGLANTAEHVFKASDLRPFFGSNQTKPEERPFLFHASGYNRIRGPNSDAVKYQDMICGECNNARTSPHDAAYEQFSRWCSRNQMRDDLEVIDLEDVFGTHWTAALDRFTRYCVKSLGCRLVASNTDLAPNFPNPVTGENMDRLLISVCRTDPLRTLPNYQPKHGAKILGKGPLLGHFSKSHERDTGRRKMLTALWWENLGRFQISHWLGLVPDPAFGCVLEQGRQFYPLVTCDWTIAEMEESAHAWIES